MTDVENFGPGIDLGDAAVIAGLIKSRSVALTTAGRRCTDGELRNEAQLAAIVENSRKAALVIPIYRLSPVKDCGEVVGMVTDLRMHNGSMMATLSVTAETVARIRAGELGVALPMISRPVGKPPMSYLIGVVLDVPVVPVITRHAPPPSLLEAFPGKP